MASAAKGLRLPKKLKGLVYCRLPNSFKIKTYLGVLQKNVGSSLLQFYELTIAVVTCTIFMSELRAFAAAETEGFDLWEFNAACRF